MRSLLLAVALIGCSDPEPRRNDLPYTGEAWPEPTTTYAIDKSALAIVTNNASDTVTLLDLAKNAVVAEVPIGLDPLATDGPHHGVVDPAGEYLYTPLAYPREGAGLGPHAEHGASQVPGVLVKIRLRDMRRVGTVTIENNPGEIAMTPDGRLAVVSHFDLARITAGLKMKMPLAHLRAPIAIVDTATMTRVATPSPCMASHGMNISPDGRTLYLACYGEDVVGVVDLVDPTKVELIPLGAPVTPPNVVFGPYFVALNAAGTALVVAETEGKSLRAIDLASRKTTARTPLDGAVFGPAEKDDGGWIVPVQAPDKVVLLDASLAVVTTRAFSGDECVKPHQVTRRDGRFFLVCEEDHIKPGKVLELDRVTLATKRSFTVGAYPDVLAFPIGSAR